MKHITMFEQRRTKFIAKCQTCGARCEEWGEREDAEAWASQHERRAEQLRLNSAGPRTPALKTLERQYRENSENSVYTAQERKQWATLADEIADRIKKKNESIEGQMALFEGEEA